MKPITEDHIESFSIELLQSFGWLNSSGLFKKRNAPFPVRWSKRVTLGGVLVVQK